MKTTIILAHPWHGSFNKSIMDTTIEQLVRRKKDYQIIDLNKDQFNPVLSESDLSLYSQGQSRDPLVNQYQEMLSDSDELVFIFPVWWFDVPAILKGFLDKVMLKNFAYVEESTGLKGLLTHIKKTTVISTSEVPTWYLKFLAGNPIEGTLIRRTFKGIGLKNVKWLNSPFTSSGKDHRRKRFLDRVAKRISV
ncbi:NAD(P)H-dependent oxidoreductase [Exiguobacterium profundum]|uniref:NAD(P)H-dependent oxidoreductase n=1 Tax=Exiguobacterium TaxID=33986 RepID=UPI0012EFE915|nr:MULTISPECIES: NAD(P)H-dependent oxidoreductase [Exiguobacterium]MBG0918720.1 flavodoxin family protein [Exiguobacterium sp. SRB7LM]MDX5979680.1 NAD(P)H-dependent oxidoreductase [Exiguobacterium profundum]VXB87893.1 Putative NADPH-quinone reductase (Modulator of drug activity B) [Exiguobacterium sp. 8H]VXC06822.1 putative NADPH-quinone reductase (Modulator of drug activity B) [Exiguobacterium sp. 8A]